MVKLVAVYSKPENPSAFEKHYFETHLPIAKKMPGLVKCEIERVTGSPMPGAETPYLAAHMYFSDMGALQAAMKSEEGKAAARDLLGFAGKYVRMFFTEVVNA
ncbi:MAG: EthD family reductase [Planctomycetota bacterium]|nr:MAG: EthD family reductase [Planctomycetota bacterium]